MKVYLHICFILFGFVYKMSSGLNENFEYECDILQKLEYLENKEKASDKLLADLESRAKETDQMLVNLENKVDILEDINATLTERLQRLEHLENKEKESDTLLADLESRAKDTDQMLVNLEGRVDKLEGINPAPTEPLQGVAGGSHYQHSGAAANYLCLPLDPTYGKHYDDRSHEGGLVYGAEYELDYRSDPMKFFPDVDPSLNLNDQNVPCAMCHVIREAMIMVPAKNTCMDGWTLEYEGLLFSGAFGHPAATEYICLDGQPETVHGGQKNEDGKLFYFVEGRCGNLPCPPYVGGRELTCAVCTK